MKTSIVVSRGEGPDTPVSEQKKKTSIAFSKNWLFA